MYTTITEQDFINAFQAIRPDNFSRDGLSELYNYLEELENMTGEPIELDVIALCCEWSEDSVEEVAENYGISADDGGLRDAVIDYLDNNTICIGLSNGCMLYQQF